MKSSKGIEIFDRAVQVGPEHFKELAKDPQAFLKKTGALEGLKGFRGITDDGGKEVVDVLSHLEKTASSKVKATFVRRGNRDDEMYCSWQIVDSK